MAAGRPVDAADLARGAGTALGDLLADHLAASSATGVYEEPSAFDAFSSGGGNVEPYAATVDALRALHARRHPASVADLGCGDGRVTAAVLPDSCRRAALVEPSAALLAAAHAGLAGRGLTHLGAAGVRLGPGAGGVRPSGRRRRPLHDYWWAPARLIVARPAGLAG